MKNSKIFWLLSLVLVLSAFLAACGGGDKEETGTGESNEKEPAGDLASEQVLNLMESAEIPTMDISLAEDAVSFNIFNNVNEGLFRLNKDNVAEPALSDGEPEVSEDGLTYTFKLRDSNWSDGTPVTAKDFVYSWQRSIDPDTGSPYGAYMMGGSIVNANDIAEGKMEPTELGVTAVDDNTLEVKLERPVPYFMSLMSFPTFYPQNEAFVTEKGDAYASNSDNLIFNGPFTLTDWDGTGLTWKMQKNPEYWDAETVKLETINVDVVKEPATAVNLYNSGEKDRAGLSGEFARQYANDENLVTDLEPTVFYFKLNQERKGEKNALANVNIRKAIASGFNKQDLVDVVLANGSLPANFLVPTEFAFDESKADFREVNGDLIEFNAEEAAKLWATGLEELGVEEVTLEILGGDTETAKNMDAYLKDQLESNLEGLTINLKAVPFGVRLELDESQDYDIQTAGWGPDYQDPMTFIDLFVTGSPQNKMSYSNSEYDALVESAKGDLATDPAGRWEAMAKAEKILLEDEAAIAPIYQRGAMALQQPYVHDIIKHPFGGDFSYKWAYISAE